MVLWSQVLRRLNALKLLSASAEDAGHTSGIRTNYTSQYAPRVSWTIALGAFICTKTLLVICWNMLVIDSDGTLVGVFRNFSPWHYVQKYYYKYFYALSTQRRHSEDDNVTFYCVKTVEDTRPMPIKPYTYQKSKYKKCGERHWILHRERQSEWYIESIWVIRSCC